MGRPREVEKRRDLALRAAAVLEQRGLSIAAAELAQALGVNRTALLYHFRSYAEIVQAALVELLAEQATFLASQVDVAAHPVDQVYARMRAVHLFHKGRESRLVFLTQALAVTGGADVTAMVRSAAEHFASGRQHLIDALATGVREGTVAPCDPAVVVALARAVVDGLIVQRVTEDSAIEPMITFFWEHVLRPLKRTPRSKKEALSP
jgi:AcrR family transcriptional regulator